MGDPLSAERDDAAIALDNSEPLHPVLDALLIFQRGGDLCRREEGRLSMRRICRWVLCFVIVKISCFLLILSAPKNNKHLSLSCIDKVVRVFARSDAATGRILHLVVICFYTHYIW